MLIAAETAPNLKAAAMKVFELYFKNQEFVYHAHKCYEQRYFNPDDVESENEYMSVNDLRYEEIEEIIPNSEQLYRILEHFGSFIRKMLIVIDTQHVFDRLMNSCRENLTELTILIDTEDLEIKQPFPMLHKLKIITADDFIIFKSWRRLNRYFPVLRSLDIVDHSCLFKFKFTFVVHMPHLKEFSYYNQKMCDDDLTRIKNRRRLQQILFFLDKNKQITNLRLNCCLNEFDKLAQRISWKECQHIEYLDLSTYDPMNIGPITHLKNIQTLKLTAMEFSGWEMGTLPKLESLCYRHRNGNINPDWFSELFRNFVNLSSSIMNFEMIFHHEIQKLDLKHVIQAFKILFDGLEQMKEIIIKCDTSYKYYESTDLYYTYKEELKGLRKSFPKRPIHVKLQFLKKVDYSDSFSSSSKDTFEDSYYETTDSESEENIRKQAAIDRWQASGYQDPNPYYCWHSHFCQKN